MSNPHTANRNARRQSASAQPGYVPPVALDQIAKFTQKIKMIGQKRLDLNPHCTVLDLGCGTGVDTVRMAQTLDRPGMAIGVDIDPAMISIGRKLARTSGVSDRTSFFHASAEDLPFEDDTFDACWMDRLLQHLTDPLAVLHEVKRVLKSGGRIVIADADWHSLSIHHPDLARERHFVGALSRIPPNPGAGRQLLPLYRSLGLSDPAIEVFPILWTDFQTFKATSLSFPNLLELLDSVSANSTGFADFMTELEAMDADHQFFATASVILISSQNQAN